MGNKRLHRSIVLESGEKAFYRHNIVPKHAKQLLKFFLAPGTQPVSQIFSFWRMGRKRFD